MYSQFFGFVSFSAKPAGRFAPPCHTSFLLCSDVAHCERVLACAFSTIHIRSIASGLIFCHAWRPNVLLCFISLVFRPLHEINWLSHGGGALKLPHKCPVSLSRPRQHRAQLGQLFISRVLTQRAVDASVRLPAGTREGP